MSSKTEIILSSLINDINFARRVLPYLKKEYFEQQTEKIIFSHIENFFNLYSNVPSFDALFVNMLNDKTIKENDAKDLDTKIGNLKSITDEFNNKWLVENTENFCQERALTLALEESIYILNGNAKNKDWGAIPEILKEALTVSFDTNIGHDYYEDSEIRFDSYHKKENKIPFLIDVLDKATNNGVAEKTLNMIVGGVHGGKSAFLCHLSATYLKQNKNVLYITCEMSEEAIASRIDANLFNMNIDDIFNIPKNSYKNKINELIRKSSGKLKIKEYPTGECNVSHIRSLLNELWLKKNFEPDVILIDYLNILSSARFKAANVNSYTYFKSVSEEIRGLAIEQGLPIWTATQVNRGGYNNSDPSLDSISDSFGVAMTADFAAVLVSSDELIQKQQIVLKQLKNRYSDLNKFPKMMLGFDRAKMKFYDINVANVDSVDDLSMVQPPINNNFSNFKFEDD